MVDLTEVSYMDASGIATLVEGLKTARNRQTTLSLKGLQGRVRHLFEVTGLLTLFETSGRRNASSAAKVS
jgi:anti-sigma B factor antagonist